MYCSKCGHEIQDDAAFCAKCGAKIEQQQQNPLNQTFTSPKPTAPSLEVPDAESASIASLVMGIIGIVASFLLAGIVLGPLAISKGKQARLVLDNSNYNFNIALAGVITGIIGLVLSVFFAIYWLVIIFIVGALGSLGSLWI